MMFRLDSFDVVVLWLRVNLCVSRNEDYCLPVCYKVLDIVWTELYSLQLPDDRIKRELEVAT